MMWKLNRWQALGLALVLTFCALAITGAVCHAETLQMLPSHGPSRVSDFVDPNPAWFGLAMTIGAILFMWSVIVVDPTLFL